MIKRMLAMLLALGVVFGGIFGWKAYKASQASAARAAMKLPAATISSTEVAQEQWQATVTSVGTLNAIQGVDVSGEVSGIVSSIAFDSGQSVEAGSLLVQLDDASEQANLRALQARLELARLDYQRASGLAQRTALSQAQLDRARSEMDSLAASVEEQKVAIARKAIRAPFSGQLGIRLVDVGQFLSPGMPIVTLQRLDTLYVDFNVPERYLQSLAIGQRVEIGTAAYPDRLFAGEVSAISPRVDERTRNVQLRATMPNDEALLRPGMFARVSVLAGGEESVLTLPRTAITFYPYGDSVFLILGGGDSLTVERRQVTTGTVREGRVRILSGVNAGDQVVSAGQLKLRSGQPVVIDNSVELPKGVERG
ncbi:MAG: efflux RND transporter periplasmic adaptor subunit [Pseudomonadales bacterium]|nr:efflux RND transporter periplasmic adaptor subunit [Pseudomonadales bacterium]